MQSKAGELLKSQQKKSDAHQDSLRSVCAKAEIFSNSKDLPLS